MRIAVLFGDTASPRRSNSAETASARACTSRQYVSGSRARRKRLRSSIHDVLRTLGSASAAAGTAREPIANQSGPELMPYRMPETMSATSDTARFMAHT